MTEKTLNARIVHKHDIEANWIKATGLIPMPGEIIIYDRDDNITDESLKGAYSYERIKVGDGVQNVNDLPFVDDAVRGRLIEQINNSTKDVVTVDGGGRLSLEDIFGEPPYTIEFTDEIEELSNITVAAGDDYDTYRLRNVAILTEVPTQMNDGDIALVIKSGG